MDPSPLATRACPQHKPRLFLRLYRFLLGTCYKQFEINTPDIIMESLFFHKPDSKNTDDGTWRKVRILSRLSCG